MTTIKVKKILYIELYVANIVQAAFFYISGFGFKVVNEKKIENENEVSIVLIQRNIKLILTSSKRITGKITEQVNLYGDFVKDIAFEVQNIEALHQQAVKHGFISIAEPKPKLVRNKIKRQAA
jgi:4-hydroxyphenylpyruvate dioxygenase